MAISRISFRRFGRDILISSVSYAGNLYSPHRVFSILSLPSDLSACRLMESDKWNESSERFFICSLPALMISGTSFYINTRSVDKYRQYGTPLRGCFMISLSQLRTRLPRDFQAIPEKPVNQRQVPCIKTPFSLPSRKSASSAPLKPP